LTANQKDIIKEACIIQLDALIAARVNIYALRAYCLRMGEEYTNQDLADSVDELMGIYSDIRKEPESLFSYSEDETNQLQLIMGWYLDKFDGNPDINTLWYKFFVNKDARQAIMSMN